MLREPNGEYKVGITKFDTREFGEAPNRRRVSLTVFYPSDEWIDEYPYENVLYQKTAPLLKDNGVNTFCGKDAVFANKLNGCDAILYNHGLSGHEMESTVLCADLASNGYVVVSIGHPYGAGIVSYTDGTKFENDEPFSTMRFRLKEIEPLWYEDMLTTIDFLKNLNESDSLWRGKLKLDNLGALGVSFGGCCSVTAALKNDEIKYAINLDGSMFVEPDYIFSNTKVMVMCSPFNIKAYRGLVNHMDNVDVHKIKKVTHFEFSDGIYLSDKGKHNREWADRVSKERTEIILEFLSR